MLLAPIEARSAAETPLDRSTAERYGELLSRYVTPSGVRYAAWRGFTADVDALSSVVARLSSSDPAKLAPAERDALYINLYNARILELVLVNAPNESIKEITPGITGYGVFTKPAVTIRGKRISLRELENRLRDESKDPRIHFAINCASRSCPPIAKEPYRGETLDAQLDRSTRAFLATPGALAVKKPDGAGKTPVTVECSKIFDWYAKDFAATGGVAAFIAKHGPADVAEAIATAAGAPRLVYQEYDWSLNAAP